VALARGSFVVYRSAAGAGGIGTVGHLVAVAIVRFETVFVSDPACQKRTLCVTTLASLRADEGSGDGVERRDVSGFAAHRVATSFDESSVNLREGGASMHERGNYKSIGGLSVAGAFGG